MVTDMKKYNLPFQREATQAEKSAVFCVCVCVWLSFIEAYSNRKEFALGPGNKAFLLGLILQQLV